MGATPKTLSREDLKTSVDELIDTIVNGTDEHLQAYVTRLAEERAAGFRLGLFKTWSANNTFFLKAQVARRGSSVKSLYAGVDQWRKRGRSVRTEELTKPYLIFGSPIYRRRANGPAGAPAGGNQIPLPNAGPTPAQNQQGLANQAQTVLGYRKPPVIEVFDWTQTVADDPEYAEPDWGVPLAFGDVDTLALLIESSPVPVNVRNDISSRNEHGWLDADGITVDGSMPIGNRIFTLTHELAHHHLGHLEQIGSTRSGSGKEEARATCEQEAALAQFLSMKMLGLDEAAGNDVTAAAGEYLRMWTRVDAEGNTVPVEGHKTKRKLIVSRLDAAFRAADQIVTAYAQLLAEQEQPVTV